jgi:glycine dehydrogenase
LKLFKFSNHSYRINRNGNCKTSLLDESTAAAEAMALLFDVRSRDQKKIMFVNFVSEEILPQTLSVLQTRTEPISVVGNHQEFDFTDDFMEQFFNIQENMVRFMIMLNYKKANDNEIKVAVAADILSLVKLTSREKWVQRSSWNNTTFWNLMGYGGPHAAYFAKRRIQTFYARKNY